MSEIVGRLNAALEGRYRIERELGEGGMATVYVAGDVKHKRQVALKVLKPELAAVVGAERFLGEIEVTAHLQHPNILPLFDSGEADGFLYYVMPYVEGESLRDRLDREHQLPVEEVQRLATEVAEALDHAHRQGVVHRDIKPANILLRDNRPLVADFGIALAVGAAGGTRLTETGLSVGTPYYMSPEQATGDQQVGPQTDIYALGCVTYEMLTGDPPYTGSTAQAVLGKIIQGGGVSATQARSTVPTNVDAAIRKALEKLPADRFDTAQHFADALNDPGFRYGATGAVDEEAIAGWKRRAQMAAGVAVVMAALAVWGLFRPQPEPQRAVTRVSVRMPDDGSFAGPEMFAIAQDGSFMVYQGPTEGQGVRLWLRRWDALAGSPIQDTEGAANPAISPDGQEVAFLAAGALRVVPIRGGVSRTLTEDARTRPAWSVDGRWLYYASVETGGLFRVPAGGGSPETVARLDSASSRGGFLWSRALPNPDYVLTEIDHGGVAADTVAIVDIAAGTVQPLFAGNFPIYSKTGHILFTVDGSQRPLLMAVPFDLDAMEVTGDPVPIAEDLIPNSGGWYHYDNSATGRLIYRTEPNQGALDVWIPVWVTREGAVQVVDPDWRLNPGDNNRGIAISPDGSRVAVNVVDGSGQEDIYVKQLPRGPFSRITTDPVEDVRPKWTRDGRSLYYMSRRGEDEDGTANADVWIRRADGIGEPSLVMDYEINIWEAELGPDGRVLIRIGGQVGVAGERDILLREPGDSVAVPIMDAGYDEKAIALSPDGRWLAYESDETGRDEVYVRSFPDVRAGKFPVSQSGGNMPVWANTANELYFVNGDDELVAATYEAGEAFRVVDLEPLFELPPNLLFQRTEFYALYDVSPDDQRFMWYQSTVDQADRELILVDNWAVELREPEN